MDTRVFAGSVLRRRRLRREPLENSVTAQNSERMPMLTESRQRSGFIMAPSTPLPILHCTTGENSPQWGGGGHSSLGPKAEGETASVLVTLGFASFSPCCKAGVRAGIAGG